MRGGEVKKDFFSIYQYHMGLVDLLYFFTLGIENGADCSTLIKSLICT